MEKTGNIKTSKGPKVKMTDKEIEQYGRLIEGIESKWLEFHVGSHSGKTYKIEVWTAGREFMLGEISWFGRWRRYAFSPVQSTVFEWECQRTIADVCEKMTRDHGTKYEELHPLRGNVDYALAIQLCRLQEALDRANKNAAKDGKLGVMPQSGGASFRESASFHAKVRKVIKDNGGFDLIDQINTLKEGDLGETDLGKAVYIKICEYIEANGYRRSISASDL